ncbi:hypothetical protein GGQ74_003093 [Desulfobaculum xiamenense]|uniref:Uncharacterized protein n=1 Tax=Desulfobaculum xiamenense TaxID=995050 RepID=A0A846QMR4_9BACT|nr:hypothetical protein [Desulfobaculum xiamenense]NJB69391.1 hypothetical protein [Desulfobaculum xiamenense]
MDLKASIARAWRTAKEEGRDMVVGKERGTGWIILPMDDSRSDMMDPSIIVTPTGLRYPDDHDTVAQLIARGE